MGSEFRHKCITNIKLPKSKIKLTASDGTKYNINCNEKLQRENEHLMPFIDMSHNMNLMMKDSLKIDMIKSHI